MCLFVAKIGAAVRVLVSVLGRNVACALPLAVTRVPGGGNGHVPTSNLEWAGGGGAAACLRYRSMILRQLSMISTRISSPMCGSHREGP